jgi:hypothetical protein
VKIYRCKHSVEAMRWTDMDDDRVRFAAWFDRHGTVFETRGSIALLPDLITREDGDTDRVEPGEWIVCVDDAFIAMSDEVFHDTYEEVA